MTHVPPKRPPPPDAEPEAVPTATAAVDAAIATDPAALPPPAKKNRRKKPQTPDVVLRVDVHSAARAQDAEAALAAYDAAVADGE